MADGVGLGSWAGWAGGMRLGSWAGWAGGCTLVVLAVLHIGQVKVMRVLPSGTCAAGVRKWKVCV